jgi:hypothetical protein
MSYFLHFLRERKKQSLNLGRVNWEQRLGDFISWAVLDQIYAF